MELTNESFNGIRLHPFQVEIKNVRNQNEDCLFVDAPTGAGKTLAFSLPTFCNFLTFRRLKTLIISPTNVLIHQTEADIMEEIKKNKSLSNVEIKVLNRNSIRQKDLIKRGVEIMRSFQHFDIIISNPDIISLVLSGFYQTPNMMDNKFSKKMRTPSDIFSEIDVIIFDEYHLYTEEEIGKIIAFMLFSRISGWNVKFVFSSATPNDDLLSILKTFNFTHRVFKSKIYDSEQVNFRKIRGKIELDIVDTPILKEVEKLDNSWDKKTLFLFNHKIDAEKAMINLLSKKVSRSEIFEITGFSSRSKSGEQKSKNIKFIIATNSGEQGLNLDVTLAHIEPGLHLENLYQRYGRIGRKGMDGKIVIHTESEIVRHLQPAGSFEDLKPYFATVLSKRETVSSKIERHLGAFMALCNLRMGRTQMKDQIFDEMKKHSTSIAFKMFLEVISFHKEIQTIKTENYGDIKDRDDILCWWKETLSSLGFFRGQSRTVDIMINRNNDIFETSEDLVWVKRWTEYEKNTAGENLFVIKRFLEIPQNVSLQFTLPGNYLTISYNDFRDIFSVREKIAYKIKEFMEDAFEDTPLDINEFNNKLGNMLKMLTFDMLIPLGVKNVSEYQIL